MDSHCLYLHFHCPQWIKKCLWDIEKKYLASYYVQKMMNQDQMLALSVAFINRRKYRSLGSALLLSSPARRCKTECLQKYGLPLGVRVACVWSAEMVLGQRF